jgi:hypothetical protein
MGFNLPVLNRRRRTTRAVSVFTPASLFTAGESGYWLDPSDFTTMWQDSQGVTPVTATGQTCGLILDKRIGTRTQVFDDANVTFGGPAGYAGRLSSGVYEYARDAGGGGSVSFGGLVVGRAYLVSLQISAYAGAVPGITGVSAQIRNASNVAVGTPLTAAGTLNLFYVADGTFFRVTSNFNGAGGTISNVSILEVPGNHFVQATAAKRPILGTEPLVGRRNLLLQTGLTGATSGTPGTAPTGWPFLVSGGTTTVIPGGGSLGGDAIRLSAVANRHLYSQSSLPMAANSTYIFSVQCIVHTSISIVSFANLSGSIPVGTTLEYLIDGVVVPSGTALPLGPCTVAVRATTSTTAGVATLRLGIGTAGAVTADVTFWDPQYELGSTRTAYQRVTDQWNVTQAGVPNVYYLQGDGTDDVLGAVAAIPANASTSAQQIFGLRTAALVSAIAFTTRATLAGGSNTPSAAPGSMGLRLINFASSPTMVMSGVNRVQMTITSVTADTKYVYSLLGDISAPSMVARRNAAPDMSNTTSLGGGTFTDSVAYILADTPSTAFFPGRIYQAVMRFGPNLTADQITQTETFVNSKTGAY